MAQPSAAARGVAVKWRPFLLGPLFAAQGWRDSPFNVYRTKGRYMWRDMQRICDSLGLPLIEALGLDAAATIERAVGAENKEHLKAEIARAIEIGLPGAPCLVTSDGEVFWGNGSASKPLALSHKPCSRTKFATL